MPRFMSFEIKIVRSSIFSFFSSRTKNLQLDRPIDGNDIMENYYVM